MKVGHRNYVRKMVIYHTTKFQNSQQNKMHKERFEMQLEITNERPKESEKSISTNGCITISNFSLSILPMEGLELGER